MEYQDKREEKSFDKKLQFNHGMPYATFAFAWCCSNFSPFNIKKGPSPLVSVQCSYFNCFFLWIFKSQYFRSLNSNQSTRTKTATFSLVDSYTGANNNEMFTCVNRKYNRTKSIDHQVVSVATTSIYLVHS